MSTAMRSCCHKTALPSITAIGSAAVAVRAVERGSMRITNHQQQQLVSRAAIAEMTGVQRSAITNWERRYTDFPSPTRAGGTDYYYLSDVLTWLKGRSVPPRARREDEREGATYADRVRTALIAASEAEAVEDLEAEGFPAARGTAGEETDGEHLSSADILFREQDEGHWGSGLRVSFLYLLFCLVYLRWAQPRRWAVVRRAAAQDQAGTHIHRFLPAVAQQVEQTLAAQGVSSAMAVRLEALTPVARKPSSAFWTRSKVQVAEVSQSCWVTTRLRPGWEAVMPSPRQVSHVFWQRCSGRALRLKACTTRMAGAANSCQPYWLPDRSRGMRLVEGSRLSRSGVPIRRRVTSRP